MDPVEGKSTSVALSLPIAWYAISITRGISEWIHPSGGVPRAVAYIEGNPIDRNIYLALIVLGILFLIARRIDWREMIRANVWMFALLAYMLASILWSDFQEIAFKRWVKFFGSIVMALIVLTEPEPVEAMIKLLRWCFLLIIPLNIITIKYFREIGVGWDYLGSEMWTGITRHKNMLGEMCMISGMYFVWDTIRSWGERRIIINIGYMAMIIYLMGGSSSSRSVSSMFILLMGLALFFGFQLAPRDPESLNRFFKRGIIVLLLCVGAIQVGVMAFSQDRSIFDVSLQVSGRDPTLTGRTELWTDILQIASNHPLFGVGYGSFWIGNLSNNLWERHIWMPQQAHNGYIDVYVELGLTGLALLAGLLIATFNKIKERFISNFEIGRFQMALFVMLVVHNVPESSFLQSTHGLWFIFLLIALNVPPISKEIAAEPEPAGHVV